MIAKIVLKSSASERMSLLKLGGVVLELFDRCSTSKVHAQRSVTLANTPTSAQRISAFMSANAACNFTPSLQVLQNLSIKTIRSTFREDAEDRILAMRE